MTPKQYLDLAREAYRAKDYAESLRLYEYFFDHALDDDPASFYGVRLSYCLSEWVRLGKCYPEAKTRLEQKAEESLALLNTTRNPENFHDYVSITEYLERPTLAIKSFLEYHEKDSSLSSEIVRFVWEKLILDSQWEICSHYLTDSKASYKISLNKYDEATLISKQNPQFGGEEFNEQIRGWYVTEVTNLLHVLFKSGRMAEANEIRESVLADMAERGRKDIPDKILRMVL